MGHSRVWTHALTSARQSTCRRGSQFLVGPGSLGRFSGRRQVMLSRSRACGGPVHPPAGDAVDGNKTRPRVWWGKRTRSSWSGGPGRARRPFRLGSGGDWVSGHAGWVVVQGAGHVRGSRSVYLYSTRLGPGSYRWSPAECLPTPVASPASIDPGLSQRRRPCLFVRVGVRTCRASSSNAAAAASAGRVRGSVVVRERLRLRASSTQGATTRRRAPGGRGKPMSGRRERAVVVPRPGDSVPTC